MSDPVESAQAAGLRYVSDTQPGIRRKSAGKGFTLCRGRRQDDSRRKELTRIRSLAIPPAYTDVWICPSPNGHIQATGRDARGRKQYRYHPKWREVRDETKFGRMLAFSQALPKIRERGSSATSACRACPGRRCWRRWSGCSSAPASGWATTSTPRPTAPSVSPRCRTTTSRSPGSNLRFEFRGKSGKTHKVDLNDRRLARIVQRCQALPGEDLFQYLDEDGVRQTIGSGDVNDYLREISRPGVHRQGLPHLGRHPAGVAALTEIGRLRPRSDRQSRNVLKAIDQVAEQLNNTRAVCRKYYVHPAVFESYMDGKLLEHLGNGSKQSAKNELAANEAAAVRLLQRHIGHAANGNGKK